MLMSTVVLSRSSVFANKRRSGANSMLTCQPKNDPWSIEATFLNQYIMPRCVCSCQIVPLNGGTLRNPPQYTGARLPVTNMIYGEGCAPSAP